MNPQRILSTLQRRRLAILQTVLLLSLVALCTVGMVSSTAQSSQKEREIETRIASHLPIKVKVKNAEKVKNVKNEEWIDDLEVEVTNTGTKPIYYLYFALLLPDDVLVERSRGIIYQLRYGRVQLSDFNEPIRADDAPILPKESVVLKVSALSAKSWKSLRSQGKVANPKKLRFWFQLLNHGDGTGFMGPDGLRLPNVSCEEEGKGGRAYTDTTIPLMNHPPTTHPSNAFLSLPVNFFTGNFFEPVGSSSKPAPAQFGCCSGFGASCGRLKVGFVFCACEEAEVAQSASCSYAFGGCYTTKTEETTHCTDSTGKEHWCVVSVIDQPCGSTTPTPEPTPTPDPDVCNGVARPNDDCTCAGTGASAFWQCNPMCDMPANYPKYPSIRLA